MSLQLTSSRVKHNEFSYHAVSILISIFSFFCTGRQTDGCEDRRNTIGYIYTVNHKKGGSTFVIITLENLDGF